jgi:hypothetical protein
MFDLPSTPAPIMWHVHYTYKGFAGVSSVSTMSLAIKSACELLNRGAEVNQIKHRSGFQQLTADDIRRISAEAAD